MSTADAWHPICSVLLKQARADAEERQDELAFVLLAEKAQYSTTHFDLRSIAILYRIPPAERSALQTNLMYWADSYDALICYCAARCETSSLLSSLFITSSGNSDALRAFCIWQQLPTRSLLKKWIKSSPRTTIRALRMIFK
jgi:hypothetical protein